MGRKWTVEEELELAKYYPTRRASWDGWRYVLPGRTCNAIRRRACALGLADHRRAVTAWDEIEDRLVLSAALKLSRETGRTVGAIGGRIQVLAAKARAREKRIREQRGEA